MKKKAIVLLAFAVALTAVSCQKEAMKEAETTPTGEGMTISAVTEGIGADVKADLAYKYDVIWRTGDKICVKNSKKESVEFTLVDGAGTTKGTFSSTGGNISGEVEGFYPASVADLIWPAEQQNNHVPPMYCKKTLSSTQNQTFNFASLGSVLQLNFNSTTAGIVLKSIEVKADEAMSGAFTIENGQAKVSQPEGDKPGIILDLGEGVTLGTSAKKFNIAVPAGEYHGLSIVLTATNGKECTINAKKDKAIEIVFNTVNTLAVSGEFKPAGALPGVFTVSDNGGETTTPIHFSQGNLYYDGSKFNFEANQYSFKDSWDATHVSHFYWSKDPNEAIKEEYTWEQVVSGDDVFFTNADDFKVNVGDKEQSDWRTLSTAEWQYLFNTRVVNGGTGENYSYSLNITYGGKMGLVLYPDDYSGSTLTSGTDYTDANFPADCVFLPAAGYRFDSGVNYVGDRGYYWSSTALGESNACRVYFISSKVTPGSYDYRYYGYSVRLITESN